MNWTVSLASLHDDVRTVLHRSRAQLAEEPLKQILSKAKLVKEGELLVTFFDGQLTVHRDKFL